MPKKKPLNYTNPQNSQKIKSLMDPSEWRKLPPRWAFEYINFATRRWSISNCDNVYEKILVKLKSFGGCTWEELTRQTHDSGKSSSHFVDIKTLSKEAQKEVLKIENKIDSLFSLRLNNKERLIGLLQGGIFYVIWYDEGHQFCISQKNTPKLIRFFMKFTMPTAEGTHVWALFYLKRWVNERKYTQRQKLELTFNRFLWFTLHKKP